MTKVLFVCKQNAGRSQMSEAVFARAAAIRDEIADLIDDLVSGLDGARDVRDR